MIKSLFLTVWILLAFTAAAGSSPRHSGVERRKLDDGSWPIGTKVYWEFVNDGWYEGKITDFDADGYTITWCEDSIDYDDFSDDDVDQMVQNYKTMVTDTGGTAECGPDDMAPAQAANMAPTPTPVMASGLTPAPTEDDSWPTGTKVYWEFVNDGWYEGKITDFDADGYTITWCEDSIDYDDFSDDDVDQMVQNYKTMVTDTGGTAECGPDDFGYAPTVGMASEPTSAPTEEGASWDIGTKVYSEFDDGWYKGTITDYDQDGYTITWCDESMDYDDFSDDDVDQMVENYRNMVGDNGGTASCGSGTSVSSGEMSSSDGMNAGAKFAIVAVVLLAVFGGVFYIRRLKMSRKEEMQNLHGSSRNDGTREIA